MMLEAAVRRRLRPNVRAWLRHQTSTLKKVCAAVTPDPEVQRRREAAARIELLMRFESLGENCELAFVQDHLGAKPMGLFGWSGIKLPQLIEALETDLVGIGEREHTIIRVNPVSGEYYTSDLRYGMDTHTQMFEHESSAEDTLTLLCRRAVRLKEKLFDDLSEGTKIFVFQSVQPPEMADIFRLHAAALRQGPAPKLLVLNPVQGGEPVGRVEEIRPGLMLGHLDRVGYDGVRWTISYGLWLNMLAQAARLQDFATPKHATTGLKPLNLGSFG